jgi:putative AlgH/UPF0301 family transcriptional regulator
VRERGEGLLEERDAGLDDPVAHDGVVHLAAHVEDADAGVVLHDPLGQLAAAHLGHHDVRDDEMDRPRPRPVSLLTPFVVKKGSKRWALTSETEERIARYLAPRRRRGTIGS